MQFFDLYHAGQLDTALDVRFTIELLLFSFISHCFVLFTYLLSFNYTDVKIQIVHKLTITINKK